MTRLIGIWGILVMLIGNVCVATEQIACEQVLAHSSAYQLQDLLSGQGRVSFKGHDSVVLPMREYRFLSQLVKSETGELTHNRLRRAVWGSHGAIEYVGLKDLATSVIRWMRTIDTEYDDLQFLEKGFALKSRVTREQLPEPSVEPIPSIEEAISTPIKIAEIDILAPEFAAQDDGGPEVLEPEGPPKKIRKPRKPRAPKVKPEHADEPAPHDVLASPITVDIQSRSLILPGHVIKLTDEEFTLAHSMLLRPHWFFTEYDLYRILGVPHSSQKKGIQVLKSIIRKVRSVDPGFNDVQVVRKPQNSYYLWTSRLGEGEGRKLKLAMIEILP